MTDEIAKLFCVHFKSLSSALSEQFRNVCFLHIAEVTDDTMKAAGERFNFKTIVIFYVRAVMDIDRQNHNAFVKNLIVFQVVQKLQGQDASSA